MPTLEQLFKNGTLERGPYAGQTPKDAFYPRNANKIPLSSNSPIINSTTMKLVNKLRSGNGSTLEETVVEQETTGVRILGTLSQPLLYGAELGRITLRQTAPLAEMKAETTGLLPSGPIGKVFKSVRTFATKTLGIPTLATPTFTKNFSDPTKGSLEGTNNIQKDYPKLLGNIKDSANGSLIGRLLKGGIGSLTDPNQLKGKVIGEALKFGKGLLRNKLIGGGQKPAAEYDFDKFKAFSNGVKIVRNYGPNTSNLSLDNVAGTLSSLTSIVSEKGNYFDANGSTYSSFFVPTIQSEIQNQNVPGLGNIALPSKFVEIKSAEDVEESREFGLLRNTPPIQLEFEKLANQNDKITGKLGSPTRAAKISKTEKEKRLKSINNSKSEKVKYGESKSSFGIELNKLSEYDTKDENGNVVDTKGIDDLDTVVLKFESVKQSKAVNFLATITGLNESFSPSWNSNKFIGNPFNFYTYDGLERSVSFSFKIFSLNPQEHKAAWNRVNFLSSLVYPQSFEGDAGYVTAPFLRLTLGDMYHKKEGFIENLSFSFDDNTPWEIGGQIDSVKQDGVSMGGYVLPRVINVETSFKFIEQRNSIEARKFYSFGTIT